MSAATTDPDSIPCECGHMRGIHKAREPRPCATAACGCGRFRVPKPASAPEPPRIVPGAVVRELPGPASTPEPQGDALTCYSRHLRGRLRALGWDQAQLMKEAALKTPQVAARAINGTGCDLGLAERIAVAVGLDLPAMLGPYLCGTCAGKPPAGFRCLECGTEQTGSIR